ncbi:MAG: COX15/CtaA family protein, partial [Puniceicoccales bacterium]
MPPPTPQTPPKPGFSLLLFGLTLIALIWSGVLLFAGGFTTSIGAGMAFLDWPLSNGSLNPEGWLEAPDQMAEHSHRLAGMIIGLLSITLAIAYNRIEKRVWVRRIAYFLLFLVVFQGVLGGLRVRLDHLNTGSDHNLVARTFAIAHALGAQGVVLTLCSLAVLSAPRWFSATPHRGRRLTIIWGGASLGLLAVAILFGAVMRHNGAALAIPTFPAATADGDWLPTSDA